jgi:Regulator of chromosome condensation (RCC1) repeat
MVCWGDNRSGQLGDGTRTRRTTPVPVDGLTDAIAVGAGSGHTCAIRASRQVVCWGDNSSGQLGIGTRTNSRAPVEVSGLTDAIAITVGSAHTCAVRASGEAVCWGWNEYQALGDGTRQTRLTPIPPVAGSRAAAPTGKPGPAPVHRCGRLAGQDASRITAKRTDCKGAKRVVRRWKKTLPQRNGNGRILGLYCRYRELGHDAASVRCVGAHGRVVRWRTKSIY